jgi:hypothetical protein
MENVEVWTKAVTGSVAQVADTLFAFLPNLLGSLALVLVGWLLARVLRSLTRKLVGHLLERLARQRVARTSAIDTRMQQTQTYQSAPAVAGAIVYFMVLVFFFAAAIEALGLPTVSNVLSLVTAYLPRVLAAAMIVFIGLWAGDFVNTLMSRTTGVKDLHYAPLLGRGLQIVIGIVFLIIAIGQLGIDSSVLIIMLAIVFATTFGGGRARIRPRCAHHGREHHRRPLRQARLRGREYREDRRHRGADLGDNGNGGHSRFGRDPGDDSRRAVRGARLPADQEGELT